MKYLLIIIIINLLCGCTPKPRGEWVNIFSEEEWYQKNNTLEKNYRGVIYDKGERKWTNTKEEYNRYFIELWYTHYQIHSPVDSNIDLQTFVGKKVELRGKETEFIYGGKQVKKILPGKIRLLSKTFRERKK